MDKVRSRKHRTLKEAGDNRLSGTNYLWPMRPQQMDPKAPQQKSRCVALAEQGKHDLLMPPHVGEELGSVRTLRHLDGEC